MARVVTKICWQRGPVRADGMTTTCMLPAGHAGPHHWTRDAHVRFEEATDG